MDIQVRHHCLRLHRPLPTARGEISERDVWIVRLTDGELVGWGEAAPLAGFGGGDVAQTALVLADAPATVDATGLDELRRRWRTPATITAMGAFETALFDLAARRAGEPLHRFLGGTGEGRVRTAKLLDDDGAGSATLPRGGLHPEGWSHDQSDRGITAVIKLKSTGDVDADLARLRDLADRHPGARFRLDANGAWREDQAWRFREGCADLPLDFVEQPLPAADLGGHRHLHEAGLPIALDESLALLDRPAEAVGCCRACVVKSQWWRGDPRTWIEGCLALGMRVVVSDVLGSAIGRAHAAHLAAGLVPDEVHGLGTDHLIGNDVADLRAVDGVVHLPDAPGIGLEPRDG